MARLCPVLKIYLLTGTPCPALEIFLITGTPVLPSKDIYLHQGPREHQEVSSTPVTKVKKMIVVFWDLVGAIKR